jgi:ABC-type polysaccharide/polyol phosphate transport system ATPase subunit
LIHLINACRHKVKERPGKKIFLMPTTLSLPARERTAILVREPDESTILMRLFAGQLRLTSGVIKREVMLSPPIASLGNVPKTLTPYEAIQFASRLYGMDAAKMMAIILLLTEIDDYIDIPLSEIPAKYRSRFNHALWLSVKFDCYTFVNKMLVSKDPEYNERLTFFMQDLMADSGFLFFTSDVRSAMGTCDGGIVFHENILIPFENISNAVEFFES